MNSQPTPPPSTNHIGFVGLGRMGANMCRRLSAAGINCVGWDRDPSVVEALAEESVITGAATMAELVAALPAPRSVWVMVPAAFVDSVVDELAPLMEPGDTVIDGGNSHYPTDIARAQRLSPRGIHYVDVGTSGGVHGLERGYCLMIGGEPEPVSRLDPVFAALAPGFQAAERTVGRSGPMMTEERGYLHCGPVGAGHFVKMVHNGIEYAIMAAYAEGFALLERADIGSEKRAVDAETAPLADPSLFQYDFDIDRVAEVWRRGSVIGSWMLDLTAAALHQDPSLADYEGRVSDSGEGRWTALAAIESGTPTPTIIDALFGRFTSRNNALYTNKVLSAMRAEFGGHKEPKADQA